MYNAIKLITGILLIASLASSCSKDTTREDSAAALLSQAEALQSQGQYDQAISLLDTIDVKYRDCITQRRQGTMLRLRTLISLTNDSISYDESRRPALTAAADSMRQFMTRVNLPGTDGFFVDRKGFTGREMDATSMQARVDDKGYLFVIVNHTGKAIGLNSVTAAGFTTPPVTSVSMEGSELMTIQQEAAIPLCEAIVATAAPVTVTLNGSKGHATIKLNAEQAASLARTLQYAKVSQALNTANIRREKYERLLPTLQEQLQSLEAEINAESESND